MNKVIGIVVVVLIVLGGWYWYSSTQSSTSDTATNTPSTDTTGTDTTGQPTVGIDVSVTAPKTVTITYGASGFSPSLVTINKGDTITFTNGTSNRMWVATAMHPAHEGYDSTSRSTHCAAGYTGAKPFDQCADGATYSFTFDKTGTWGYHNHSNSSDFGKVVVQ